MSINKIKHPKEIKTGAEKNKNECKNEKKLPTKKEMIEEEQKKYKEKMKDIQYWTTCRCSHLSYRVGGYEYIVNIYR